MPSTISLLYFNSFQFFISPTWKFPHISIQSIAMASKRSKTLFFSSVAPNLHISHLKIITLNNIRAWRSIPPIFPAMMKNIECNNKNDEEAVFLHTITSESWYWCASMDCEFRKLLVLQKMATYDWPSPSESLSEELPSESEPTREIENG